MSLIWLNCLPSDWSCCSTTRCLDFLYWLLVLCTVVQVLNYPIYFVGVRWSSNPLNISYRGLVCPSVSKADVLTTCGLIFNTSSMTCFNRDWRSRTSMILKGIFSSSNRENIFWVNRFSSWMSGRLRIPSSSMHSGWGVSTNTNESLSLEEHWQTSSSKVSSWVEYRGIHPHSREWCAYWMFPLFPQNL